MNSAFHSHIAEDELEQYSLGKLQEPELAQLEEHLLVCVACQDRLDELDAFVMATQGAARHLLAEPDSRRAELWRSVRNRFRNPAFVGVAAAAGVAAAVFLVKSVQSPAPPVAVMLQASRGIAASATAPVGKPLLLHIDLTELPAAPQYSLRIVDASGAPVHSTTLKPEGNRVSALVSKDLRAGRYWVRIYESSGRGELLREFGVQLK